MWIWEKKRERKRAHTHNEMKWKWNANEMREMGNCGVWYEKFRLDIIVRNENLLSLSGGWLRWVKIIVMLPRVDQLLLLDWLNMFVCSRPKGPKAVILVNGFEFQIHFCFKIYKYYPQYSFSFFFLSPSTRIRLFECGLEEICAYLLKAFRVQASWLHLLSDLDWWMKWCDA